MRASANPLSRRSRPGFPREDTTGVPGWDGADDVHGPVHDLDAEHGDRRKGDWVCPVTAPGVVIRNSKISCSGAYAVASFDGAYAGTPLLLEDIEVAWRSTRDRDRGPGRLRQSTSVSSRSSGVPA